MKILPTLTALLLSHTLAHAELPGTWNATSSSDAGERQYIVELTETDGNLTGTSTRVGEGPTRTFDRITASEKSVTFELDFERDGNQGVVKITADRKSPDTLDGKWTVEGSDGTVYMSGPWTATKEIQFSLAGQWDALGTTESGEEHPSVLTVTGTAPNHSAKFVTDTTTLDIESLKVDGKQVNLTFTLDFDGTPVPTTIEAQATDANTLNGKWLIKNETGETAATGPWTATRKPTFAIAGAWTVTAALPEGGEYNGSLYIYGSGDKLTGTSKSDNSDEIRTLSDLKFDGKSFSYNVPMEFDGQSGKITINATAEGADTLKGNWTLTGADGTEVATDTLTAKRQ